MTHIEHKTRHQQLQESFDELIADYLRWNPGKLLENTNCLELMLWSAAQARDPLEDSVETAHSYSLCAHCGEPVPYSGDHVCNSIQTAVESLSKEVDRLMERRKPS